MDLEQIINLVQSLWLPTAIAVVFLWFFIWKMTQKLEEITFTLKTISKNVWKELLSPQNTVMIFKLMLFEHCNRKIEYAKNVLIENHIDETYRQIQIKRELKNEFVRITTEEANKLSSFNTPAGDLGQILMNNIDFDKFMNDIYVVFFDKNIDIEKKCKDMMAVMNGYINDLIKIIENKIRNNLF